MTIPSFDTAPEPELSKEECLAILGKSIELEQLQILAESAKKHGPEKFASKIETLLKNTFVKMAL